MLAEMPPLDELGAELYEAYGLLDRGERGLISGQAMLAELEEMGIHDPEERRSLRKLWRALNCEEISLHGKAIEGSGADASGQS